MASDNQHTTEGNEFEISFPSKNKKSFSYNGIFGSIDDIDPADKNNWYPAILLSLPTTHVEMPHVENEKSADKAKSAGFDVYVMEY